MQFEPGNIYHVFNRGNDKQQVFFSDNNYLFFIAKIGKYILPHCSLLAYCLMPNHFHLLVHADERTVQPANNGSLITKNVFSEGIRMLLSSYAKAINKQETKYGNLFQQKTRAKCVNEEAYSGQVGWSYAEACLHYIHQNPLKAGLVKRMEDWSYSSFSDYAGLRNGSLCDKKFAVELLGLKEENFYKDSYTAISPGWMDTFFH